MRGDPAKLGRVLMPPRITNEVNRSWEDALGLLEQPLKQNEAGKVLRSISGNNKVEF